MRRHRVMAANPEKSGRVPIAPHAMATWLPLNSLTGVADPRDPKVDRPDRLFRHFTTGDLYPRQVHIQL